MFEQFGNMLLNPLIQKLNEHGVNVDAETVKKAIANSPQIIAQIESILMASSSQEKIDKIKALILQASSEGESTNTPPK